jgi:DNA gyrase/topoisomerase IV subunit A
VIYGEIGDVIIASKQGQIIRMDLSTVKILGRDTQGVTMMKMRGDDKVASVTVIPKSAEPLIQTPEEESKTAEPEVALPVQEDRPVQEVETLIETDSKEEIQKEVEEIQEEAKEKEEDDVTEGSIPEWALVHQDVKAGLKDTKEVEKKEKDSPAPKSPSAGQDPNWWGGKKS